VDNHQKLKNVGQSGMMLILKDHDDLFKGHTHQSPTGETTKAIYSLPVEEI
jgi:hypothetical protein